MNNAASTDTLGDALTAIMITPVLHALQLAHDTMERRISEAQRHLVETTALHQTHVLVKLADADQRYQQRFEAQKEAMATAFAAQQTAMMSALASAEKAVTKAELANEKRFESVNEFRGVLTEQARLLVTRAEVETIFRGMAEKLDQQTLLFQTTLAALDKRLTLQEGRNQGIGMSWGVVAGMAGLGVALLGVIMAALRAAGR